eukprot:TRINITY_DN583_c0_g1_i2.p1 TRINITY_DN583_c0_g1~~TRINITY_DN583_c0_g1_i2.p1  ORF type:complete len:1369 (-),score=402.05 TRINITY_DN583_c0_g1_i2:140-4246(-)
MYGISWRETEINKFQTSKSGCQYRYKFIISFFLLFLFIQSDFSPDGSCILSLFRDNSILAWSFPEFKLLHKFLLPKTLVDRVAHRQGAPLRLTCFTQSPNGRLLVAGGRADCLMIYDTYAKALLKAIELPAQVGRVIDLQWVSDSVISLLGDDGTIWLIVVASTCRALLNVNAFNKRFVSMSLGFNGKLLAASAEDGSLRFIDLQTALSARRRISEERMAQGIKIDAIFPPLNSVFAYQSESGGCVKTTFPANALRPLDEEFFPQKWKPLGICHSTILDSLFPPRSSGVSGASQVPLPTPRFDEENIQTCNKSTFAPWENATRKMMKCDRKAFSLQRGIPTTSLDDPRPLRELMEVMPEGSSTRLSVENLRGLLNSYGEFPTKYRLLIWRFLLHLPENLHSFEELVNRGLHPALSKVQKRFPLNQDQKLSQRLSRVLSALMHYEPMLSEVTYLPQLVFPFVRLFGRDAFSAFEVSLTVLVRWCFKFFITFPHPPLPLLSRISELVKLHLPKLYGHLASNEIGPQFYIWPLLRTFLTEILARRQWLSMMDWFFANYDKPSLLVFSAIALLRHCESQLLLCTSCAEVEGVLATCCSADAKRIKYLATQMMSSTPENLQPYKALSSLGAEFDPSVPVADVNIAIKPDGMIVKGFESKTQEDEQGMFPLPEGDYPRVLKYPQIQVDWLLEERDRIQLEENELQRQTETLRRLEIDSEKLEKEAAQWRDSRKQLKEAEEARTEQLRQMEVVRNVERQRLSEQSRDARMRQLLNLQEVLTQRLAAAKESKEQQTHRLQTLLQTTEQSNVNSAAYQERTEEVLAMEQRVSETISKLQAEIRETTSTEELKSEVQLRQAATELQQKAEMAERELEEERRVYERTIALQAEEKAHADRERTRLRNEALAALRVKEVKSMNEGLVLNHQRQLRHAAEDALLEGHRGFLEAESARREAEKKEKLSNDAMLQEIMMTHGRDQQATKISTKLARAVEERQSEMAKMERQVQEFRAEQKKQAFEQQARVAAAKVRVNQTTEAQKLEEMIGKIDNDRKRDATILKELQLEEQVLQHKRTLTEQLSKEPGPEQVELNKLAAKQREILQRSKNLRQEASLMQAANSAGKVQSIASGLPISSFTATVAGTTKKDADITSVRSGTTISSSSSSGSPSTASRLTSSDLSSSNASSLSSSAFSKSNSSGMTSSSSSSLSSSAALSKLSASGSTSGGLLSSQNTISSRSLLNSRASSLSQNTNSGIGQSSLGKSGLSSISAASGSVLGLSHSMGSSGVFSHGDRSVASSNNGGNSVSFSLGSERTRQSEEDIERQLAREAIDIIHSQFDQNSSFGTSHGSGSGSSLGRSGSTIGSAFSTNVSAISTPSRG